MAKGSLLENVVLEHSFLIDMGGHYSLAQDPTDEQLNVIYAYNRSDLTLDSTCMEASKHYKLI